VHCADALRFQVSFQVQVEIRRIDADEHARPLLPAGDLPVGCGCPASRGSARQHFHIAAHRASLSMRPPGLKARCAIMCGRRCLRSSSCRPAPPASHRAATPASKSPEASPATMTEKRRGPHHAHVLAHDAALRPTVRKPMHHRWTSGIRLGSHLSQRSAMRSAGARRPASTRCGTAALYICLMSVNARSGEKPRRLQPFVIHGLCASGPAGRQLMTKGGWSCKQQRAQKPSCCGRRRGTNWCTPVKPPRITQSPTCTWPASWVLLAKMVWLPTWQSCARCT
jgi:hypothetical protein